MRTVLGWALVVALAVWIAGVNVNIDLSKFKTDTTQNEVISFTDWFVNRCIDIVEDMI